MLRRSSPARGFGSTLILLSGSERRAASGGALLDRLDQAAIAEIRAERDQIGLDLLERLLVLLGKFRSSLLDGAGLQEHGEHAAARRVQPVVLTSVQVEKNGLVRERAEHDVLGEPDGETYDVPRSGGVGRHEAFSSRMPVRTRSACR